MSARPKFFKAEEVDEDDVRAETLDIKPDSLPWQEQVSHWFNVSVTVLIVVAFVGASGAGGWFAHEYLAPPRFSMAQQDFVTAGLTEESKHLGELAKVCQDGSDTPISCRLVFMSGRGVQLSQAQPK